MRIVLERGETDRAMDVSNKDIKKKKLRETDGKR